MNLNHAHEYSKFNVSDDDQAVVNRRATDGGGWRKVTCQKTESKGCTGFEKEYKVGDPYHDDTWTLCTEINSRFSTKHRFLHSILFYFYFINTVRCLSRERVVKAQPT